MDTKLTTHNSQLNSHILMLNSTNYAFLFTIFICFGVSCTSSESTTPPISFNTLQDTTNIAFSITGLDGPEAVRYDPDQKVYFISNWSGGGNTQNSSGFITKADDEGNIIELKFMTGTESYPLHAPRGMFIHNETLWAADVFGIHGFNKNSGEQTHYIGFDNFEIGFLNDVSGDENGTLYVTDTGRSKVFKVQNDQVSVYLDSLAYAPNGITFNPNSQEFLLAPWGGAQSFLSFNSNAAINEFATLEGGYFDGIEFIGETLFSASQSDSSIRIYNSEMEKILIKTTGRPADIGVNTHLNHIAVPYIALDRVDIWKIE